MPSRTRPRCGERGLREELSSSTVRSRSLWVSVARGVWRGIFRFAVLVEVGVE